jgi:putative two-component system response regulator
MEGLLRSEGYEVTTFHDGREARETLALGVWDLVLVGSDLPRNEDSLEWVRQVRTSPLTWSIPLVLVVPKPDTAAEVRGFEAGAEEVLAANAPAEVLQARIRVVLRHTSPDSYRQANHDSWWCPRDCDAGLAVTLQAAISMNDGETGRHIDLAGRYAAILSEAMDLDADIVASIRRGASLHDVGKVGIIDEIVKKKGRLSGEEYDRMKAHTVNGFQLLSAARVDPVSRAIALSHHERWDGSGYPQGLKGDEIPVEANITAVADIFDALTAQRPYKVPMDPDAAYGVISIDCREWFAPLVLRAFKKGFGEMTKVLRTYD